MPKLKKRANCSGRTDQLIETYRKIAVFKNVSKLLIASANLDVKPNKPK